MGSDPIALPVLNYLNDLQDRGLSCRAVFTQPDRRSGRGLALQPNAIKAWAEDRSIPVYQPQQCGPQEAQWLSANDVDLVLVMAYGQILKRDFVSRPPLGVLNLHASLLPRLRGASPLQTALALGLPRTGVSLMRIVPALDAGPVADAEMVLLQADDSLDSLRQRIAHACVPLLQRNLAALRAGKLVFHPQDPSAVTYCRILDKSDSALDFHASAAELAARVRAFHPWPGSAFDFSGQRIRVHSATACALADAPAPGTVVASAERLLIACADCGLEIHTLQRAGGKPLSADAFLRGFAIPVGSVIASEPMRPLEATQAFPWRKPALIS